MTKTQAVKHLCEIRELLRQVELAIFDFKPEVEETIESIEPYENKDELTPQQEEREEWFSDVRDALDELETAVEDNASTLEDLGA